MRVVDLSSLVTTSLTNVHLDIVETLHRSADDSDITTRIYRMLFTTYYISRNVNQWMKLARDKRSVKFTVIRSLMKLGKGKAEHFSSALHGVQTTLKRSGMDHTV